MDRIIIVFMLFIVASCHNKDTIIPTSPSEGDTTISGNLPSADKDTVPVFPDDFPSVDNTSPALKIVWDNQGRKTSENVAHAEYPRIHKLGGDTLLMTYHISPENDIYGEDIVLRKSFDKGQTWTSPKVIANHITNTDHGRNYYGFQNADFIALKNGWLLLAFVGRGKPDNNENDDVEIMISMDRGDNWTLLPVIIQKGRSWEPAMVQLPDGSIDLFYSSEAKWWPVKPVQQEILMTTSKDNGLTWSNPITAAYSPGYRDGMAVPVLLEGDKGILFSIESPGQKMPWMVWSSVKANFNYNSYATVNNGRRWYANQPGIAAAGGGPYLIQLPSGETILSVHATGGRNIGSDWRNSTQIVLVGNSMGRNFTDPSIPWPDLPVNEGAYFGCVCLLDDSTIMAATTRHFPGDRSEVWIKVGHIQI